jgi:hypothetical protein
MAGKKSPNETDLGRLVVARIEMSSFEGCAWAILGFLCGVVVTATWWVLLR